MLIGLGFETVSKGTARTNTNAKGLYGMDYLLTWNCKHIANIAMRGAIEKTCRAAGYEPPVIGTPEEFGE